MARPRSGENGELKIQYQRDKNGNVYAYTNTSYMENGEKRNKRTYLGRVDPETGGILPRVPGRSKEEKEAKKAESAIKELDRLHYADYGGVHFLDQVQRRVGVGECLARAFGTSSRKILACSIALCLADGGSFCDIGDVAETTWLTEYYGLKTSFDSGTLSKLTNKIGMSMDNIDEYYRHRVAGSRGVIAWDTTTKGTNTEMDGFADWVVGNKDGEDIRQVKVGVATDMRGVPLMERHFPGTLSDMDTVRYMIEDLRRFGREDAVLVMDRGFASGVNIKDLVDLGASFVVPAVDTWAGIKNAITEMRNNRLGRDEVFEGHAYRVWETELAFEEHPVRRVVDGRKAQSIVLPDSDGEDSGTRVKAFVVYDSKKYSDENQSMVVLMDDLMKRATEIDAKDPVKAFRKMAGRSFGLFDVVADGRKAVVRPRVKTVSGRRNKMGYFVMLCSDDMTWESMMAAYDARRLTEQEFDEDKGTDRRFRTGNRQTMEGRMFIRHISTTLKCEIRATMREAGLDRRMPAQSAINRANAISGICSDGVCSIRNVTKNARTIYELFGFELPTTIERGVMICDVEKL